MNTTGNTGRLLVVLALSLPLLARAEGNATASIGDNSFAAGDAVTIDGDVPGRIFGAGGHILYAARGRGSVFLAGGSVDTRGVIRRSLYVAGGQVSLASQVSGDVRAAGGSVILAPAGYVGRDASFAGSEIDVRGRIAGKLSAAGDRVFIDGAVVGDVEVEADDLRIGPNAQIEGRVVYHGSHEPQVDDEADIEGGIEKSSRPWRKFGVDGHRAGGSWLFGGLLWFTGVLLLGLVMMLALPAFTRQAASAALREAPASIGLGLALLVAIPILVLLLCITLIGIPLGLTVLFGYGLLLMLGYVTAGLAIGDLALARARPAAVDSTGWRMLSLLLALVVMAVVGQIPVLGALAVFVLFLAGTGAFALRVLRGYRA